MLRRSSRRSAAPRSGPGLLNTMARTAVISGTATATSRAVNSAIDQKAIAAQQEQAEKAQMKAQIAELQTMQNQTVTPPAATPATTPPAQTDLLAQLTQLAQLKEGGFLSDEEFQLAKAKLLN
jgi:hypothetical protein